MTASAQRRTPLHQGALVALAAVTALAAGLLAPAAAPAAKRPVKPVALPAFPSCASLLSYARANARRTGGRTGVPTRAGVLMPLVLDAPPPPTRLSPSAPTPCRHHGVAGVLPRPQADAGKAAPDFSQTNVQEAGVDEPDIVKTDGRTVFAIASGKLHAVDVRGADPKLVGTLDLADGYGHQLLIRGDRLLVMSNAYGGGSFAGDVIVSASQVVISEVDISAPAAMTVRRTMTMEGALVDARLTGGTARVVVGASPDYIRPAAIARATLRSFVPRTVLKSNLSGKTFRRSVVSCDDVRHPRRFSGLDLLTVLTIDLDKGLFNVDRDAIMAGAQTVYASTTGLYVASQRYVAALEAGRAVPAAQPHRHPPLRHLQARPDELRRLGQRGRLRAQPVLAVGARRRAAGGLDGGPGLVRRPDRLRQRVLRQRARRARPQPRPRRARRRPRPRRAHLRRALRRRQGLRRDVPPGRPALHARPVQEDRSARRRRAEDPRLLGLPAPDLRRPAARRRPGRHGAGPHDRHAAVAVRRLRSAQAGAQGRRLAGERVLRRRVRPARVPVLEAGEPRRRAAVDLRPRAARTSMARSASRSARRASPRLARITHPVLSTDGYTPPIGRSVVIGDLLYTLSYAGLASNRLDTLAPQSFATFPPPPPPPPNASDQPIPRPAR